MLLTVASVISVSCTLHHLLSMNEASRTYWHLLTHEAHLPFDLNWFTLTLIASGSWDDCRALVRSQLMQDYYVCLDTYWLAEEITNVMLDSFASDCHTCTFNSMIARPQLWVYNEGCPHFVFSSAYSVCIRTNPMAAMHSQLTDGLGSAWVTTQRHIVAEQIVTSMYIYVVVNDCFSASAEQTAQPDQDIQQGRSLYWEAACSNSDTGIELDLTSLLMFRHYPFLLSCCVVRHSLQSKSSTAKFQRRHFVQLTQGVCISDCMVGPSSPKNESDWPWSM